MKKIGTVQPYLFEEQLILALTKDWINAFGCVPTFEVLIDDKKNLVLKSKMPLKIKGEN